ncbi:MAG: amidohydrolase family protein [Acidimicrobiia bacterium]|nr:amidohydrolase family protein [Acidimicrobiia bacterium]
MALILRDVEVAGEVVDVTVSQGLVREVRPGLSPSGGDDLVDGQGGALLPGLHDHHLHLLALAAAQSSVRCGPPEVATPDELATALRAAVRDPVPGGWVRGVGYHESVAGLPDRDVLDAYVAAVPLRVQDRTGRLWVLNSAAIERLGLESADDACIERDASGRVTGRIWRGDDLLRERLGSPPPDLSVVGSRLACWGVTGVTDATATNDGTSVGLLAGAQRTGALPQRVRVMGPHGLRFDAGDRLVPGEVKVLLDEDRLPSVEELGAVVRSAHGSGRRVAVHCVTAAQLFLAVQAFEEAGARADRIEHASVVPGAAVGDLRRLGLRVVTQPGFVAERGDRYRRDVDEHDRGDLYPLRRLLAAGVGVGGSTDAPFTSPDPWAAMRAAVDRRCRDGAVLLPGERLAPAEALGLFLRHPDDVGRIRRVEPGAPADLVLLGAPLGVVLERLVASDVVLTMVGGEVIHDAR